MGYQYDENLSYFRHIWTRWNALLSKRLKNWQFYSQNCRKFVISQNSRVFFVILYSIFHEIRSFDVLLHNFFLPSHNPRKIDFSWNSWFQGRNSKFSKSQISSKIDLKICKEDLLLCCEFLCVALLPSSVFIRYSLM